MLDEADTSLIVLLDANCLHQKGSNNPELQRLLALSRNQKIRLFFI